MIETTFVTCWFDLGRRGDENRRNFIDLSKSTLSIPQNFIIFCDPEVADHVRNIRKNISARTIIVEMEYENIPSIIKWDEKIKLCQLPINRNIKKDSYNFISLGWSKPALMSAVAFWNPFQTTHVAWIDLGISHAINEEDLKLLYYYMPNTDKMFFHILRCPEDIINNLDIIHCLVAAGFMVGGLNEVKNFANDFNNRIEEILKYKKINIDEDIIAYLVANSPEKYKYSYGNYKHILLNHNGIREGLDHILFMLRDARERRKWQWICSVGREIVTSLSLNMLKDECVSDLESSLTEYFIGAYWTSKEEAESVVILYKNLLKDFPNFRKSFLINEQIVRNNFRFLNMEIE
jgi:hypothetical protein